MEEFIKMLLGFILILAIVFLAIYIAQAIFLNKFNKLVYGKSTAKAWIPVANIYLLGKLTFNKLVGWVLVVCVLLTGSSTVKVNGIEKTYTILPISVYSIYTNLLNFLILGLFIYAIIKYINIKKSKNNSSNVVQDKTLNTDSFPNRNVNTTIAQTPQRPNANFGEITNNQKSNISGVVPENPIIQPKPVSIETDIPLNVNNNEGSVTNNNF